jgi:hypothetical protein
VRGAARVIGPIFDKHGPCLRVSLEELCFDL